MPEYKVNIIKALKAPPVLFLTFFFIYFTFGLFIAYSNNSVFKYNNILFGADCLRVVADFLFVNHDHIRISVHPLQLILLQPLFLIANVFLHSLKVSLIIVQALCGASIVCLIKNILVLWTKNNKISILASIIYGISASTLVFVSIPETYIFAATGNTLLLYYISLLYKKEKELVLLDLVIISILTVFCFGIIPATVITNLVLFLGLISYKHSNLKHAVKTFLKALYLIIILHALLTCTQKFAYRNVPMLFENIVNTDVEFISLSIKPKKVIHTFKPVFVESLYSIRLTIAAYSKYPKGMLVFMHNPKIMHFVPSVLLLGFMTHCLIQRRKSFTKEKNFILSLIFILLINFIQLYFYGTKETFLYSQNALPHLIVLLGLAFSKLQPRMMFLTCIPFICYQIVSNSIMMFMIEKHVNTDVLKHNYIGFYMLCALITTMLICFIGLAIKKLMRKEFFEQSIEKRFALYLGIYIIYILINCIFLGMFHNNGTDIILQ